MPVPPAAIRALTNPWLPRFAEGILVLVLAWVLAGWLTSGSDLPVTPSVVPRNENMAIPSADRIGALPLFGKLVKEAREKKRPVPPPVAVSRLRLRLLGTILAGRHSAAIVTLESGSRQKLVFMGEAIKPGVILKSVESTAIVVDNHGRSERILMQKTALVSASPVPKRAGEVRHMPRAAVRAKLNDLAGLLTQARAIPHQMNGKPDGFLIQEIVPGSLYARAGLLNGDIIRKVNGQPVIRPEEGIKLFQSLKNASSIDLEIVRNGTVRTIHFDIR